MSLRRADLDSSDLLNQLQQFHGLDIKVASSASQQGRGNSQRTRSNHHLGGPRQLAPSYVQGLGAALKSCERLVVAEIGRGIDGHGSLQLGLEDIHR